MNKLVKIITWSLTAVMLVVLVFVWGKVWQGNQRQAGEDVSEIISSELTADIPEDLYDVAEEEYAIDFEAAEQPAVDIDTSFCDLVKEECKKQGIRNCEDYKMCLIGASGE